MEKTEIENLRYVYNTWTVSKTIKYYIQWWNGKTIFTTNRSLLCE